MKTLSILTLLICIFVSTEIHAQEAMEDEQPSPDKFSAGIGIGMDYGGLGGNLTFYPTHKLGFFTGVGYALAGVGYNAGLKYRIISPTLTKKYNPYGIIMYGYNSAINVFGTTKYNRMFYGPTLGIGMDYKSFLMARGYWSFAVLVPFRNSEVKTYMDDLEMNHNINFKNGLFPVAISIGYRFIIQ